MATSNTRDVELRLSAKASGNDQILQLANSLLEMGKTAGAAAPEFEQLAKAVIDLGNKAAATNTFRDIGVEVEKTAGALLTAKQSLDQLGEKFAQETARVEAYKQTQAEARAAVKQTATELDAAKTALQRYRADASAADRATVGYKNEVDKLKTSVRQLEDQLQQQKGLVNTKAEYNAVVRELDKLAASYLKAQNKVNQLDGELTQQNSRLEGAKKALHDLGLAVETVQQAEADLARTLRETSAAYTQLTTAQAQAKAINDAVAAGNEKAVAQARAAAEARAAAAAAAAAAERRAASEIEAVLLKQKLAQDEVTASTLRAAQALNNAFSTTGIRSAREIENEIVQINQALRLMASSGQVSGQEFDRAFSTAKQRVTALQREMQGLPPVVRETDATINLLRQSFSQLTAAFGAFQLGSAFLDANKQFETLRRTMTLITGSSEGAAAQIQFLRDTANRTGLSIGLLSQDFVNFSASMQTSGFALDKQREVFSAVANAAGQLGLSTDRVGLVLQALAQTANKGKVSLEELQGQLGESLPGALAIVSNGFGVTKERMLDMVKSGVDTTSFFDAFTRGTKQAFGDGTAKVVSFAAAWARLSNAFSEFSSRAADSAAFKLLVSTIDAAATNFDKLASAVKLAAEAFALFKLANWLRDSAALSGALQKNTVELEANAVATKTVAAAKETETVATRASTVALEANTVAAAANKATMGTLAPVIIGVGQAKEQAAKSAGVLGGALGAARGAMGLFGTAVRGAMSLIGGLPGLLVLTALNAREFGTAIGESTADLFGWGKKLDENEKKLKALADAEAKAASDAKALAETQKIAQQQAFNLTGQASKLYDEFVKVEKETGDTQKAIEKLAKDLELGDLKGIEAAGKALGALQISGKLTADQIQKIFGDALKNEDLLKYETNARVAFANIEESAKKAARAAADEAAAAQKAVDDVIAKGQLVSLELLNKAQSKAEEAQRKLQAVTTASQIATDQLNNTLKALADEGLRRVGTSVQEVKTGFSSAMNSAINDTDRARASMKELGADATLTSAALTKAFAKEIEAANTDKAIQQVILRLQDAKKSGELFGVGMETSFKAAIDKAIALANTDKDLKRLEDQIKAITAANPELANSFADSIEKIKTKFNELNPVMRQLQADADLLGVKLQAASSKPVPTTEALIRAYERLKMSGKATAGEVQDAFTAMAEKVIKANGGVIPEWLKVEAAARQATISIDEAGRATVKFANDSVNALSTVEQRIGTLSSKYDELTRKQADSVNAKRNEGYDAQGFAKDTAGNRLTSGTYLPPPDNSGDWTWVPKLGDFTNYPYGGYWEKKTQGRGAQMGSTTQYTGANGIGYGRGFNVGPGVAGSLVNFSTPMGPGGVAGIGATPSASPSAAPSGGGQSYTVNVNIGGRATTINTASAADADALANLLKQLGDVAGRTGG